jgi:hypothetical protein
MREFLEIVSAITIATVLGFGVKALLSSAAAKPTRPDNIAAEVWDQIFEGTGGGPWIGALERYLSLAAFWTKNYALIAGWLAFKVASKWEVWKNIVQVPSALEEIPPFEWFRIRRLLGSWVLTRFWTGTLVNILIGLVSTYLGSHTYDFFLWLCGLS